MVHMLAKNGAAQNLTENALTVGFPETDAVQFNSLNAAINFNRLQNILSELRPNTRLVLIKIPVAPVSQEVTDKAKALFGDQLVIE